MALRISGSLGLLGLKPTEYVRTTMLDRLYGGDHGAHHLYNVALTNKKRGSVNLRRGSDDEGSGLFSRLPLHSECYRTLAAFAEYDQIGGLWWTHEDPLPMSESSALLAADAAYFLLSMPSVRAIL